MKLMEPTWTLWRTAGWKGDMMAVMGDGYMVGAATATTTKLCLPHDACVVLLALLSLCTVYFLILSVRCAQNDTRRAATIGRICVAAESRRRKQRPLLSTGWWPLPAPPLRHHLQKCNCPRTLDSSRLFLFPAISTLASQLLAYSWRSPFLATKCAILAVSDCALPAQPPSSCNILSGGACLVISTVLVCTAHPPAPASEPSHPTLLWRKVRLRLAVSSPRAQPTTASRAHRPQRVCSRHDFHLHHGVASSRATQQCRPAPPLLLPRAPVPHPRLSISFTTAHVGQRPQPTTVASSVRSLASCSGSVTHHRARHPHVHLRRTLSPRIQALTRLRVLA